MSSEPAPDLESSHPQEAGGSHQSEMDSTPPPGEPKDGSTSASTLRRIVPDWLLIRLMVATFTLAILGLILGSLWPGLFTGDFSRYCLIVLISFCMAIFLFVLFPDEFQLTGVPGLDLAVKLSGPVVLFVVMFLFLTHNLPGVANGRLFLAQTDGSSNQTIGHEIVEINGVETPIRYYKVVDPDPRRRHLVGVYVEFSPPATSHKAEVAVRGRPPVPTVFDLNGPGHFALRPAASQ